MIGKSKIRVCQECLWSFEASAEGPAYMIFTPTGLLCLRCKKQHEDSVIEKALAENVAKLSWLHMRRQNEDK